MYYLIYQKELLGGCLGMIADISSTYGQTFKNQIKEPICYYLINKLKGVKKYEQLCTWAANVKINFY